MMKTSRAKKINSGSGKRLAAASSLFLLILLLALWPEYGRAVQADEPPADKSRVADKNWATAVILKDRWAAERDDEVLLGDIARLQGSDAALIEELSRIPVGRPPRAGTAATVVTLQGIRHLLRRSLPTDIFVKIAFSGSDRCLIERAYREIEAAEIERLFREWFSERFSRQEFELERVRVFLTQPVKVPDGGEINYEVHNPEPPSRQEETFLFRISHRGELIRQIRILATIGYRATMLVAAKDLAKGEVISPAKVIEKAVILRNRPDPEQAVDPSRIIGLVCRQPIRAGSELTLKMLDQPILIRKGAIIKMVLESNNLRIIGLGRARADGRQGEIIRAENLSSQGDVYGKVVSENQILVSF